MEWITTLKSAIEYMEDNLLNDITPKDVAQSVCISEFYLQKGFQIMTGYSISEYIRNRRLYLAALDLITSDTKIIDLSYKYRYETPESFTKAFSRYHGATPSKLRKERTVSKPFLPIKISVVVKGGNEMDYSVEKMKGFKIIGYQRAFKFETSYEEIPKFWDEVYNAKIAPTLQKSVADTLEEEAIKKYCIGEFGLCIDDGKEQGAFQYIIGGRYTEGEVPEGMTVYELQDYEWAKFKCIGPMPGALQAVNTKVFQEWLPGNKEFEIAAPVNIEWYSGDKGTTDIDYESGVWIPVKRK